ncbi:hypothetical protein [Rhizomonospora bruguierae]|uniref:hypothetical protein n=1 Tax=Rhizomonospora bruguierae TaxID=1581705 RepID=UPI001BCFAFAE|nr:hypothetical protein [Micromonospora sp. NBRC 107566]
MTTLPTEDEIRAVAAELGLVDERGDYPRDKRTQLAAVAMKMRNLPADEPDEPEPRTTAQALDRFHTEMVAAGFHGQDIAGAIFATVLPALIARDGLITSKETAHHDHEEGPAGPPAEEEDRRPA